METSNELLKAYPDKDYNDKLKDQFTYYDMINFALQMQLKQIK